MSISIVLFSINYGSNKEAFGAGMSFRVFLSHRFQDAAIADVIRQQLIRWGVRSEWIFQAGQPGMGLTPGKPIGNELIDEIRQTDLFILIFTHLDEDWSYCMWELGIATGIDTKQSTVIVLQCSSYRPRVRTEDLSVDVRSHANVLDFTKLFHTKSDFVVPDLDARNEASNILEVLAGTDGSVIEERAEAFHDALAKVIPEGVFSEGNRLEYIELVLDPAMVREVRELRQEARPLEHTYPNEYGNLREKAKNLLRKNLMATDKSSDKALERFGVVRANESLDALLDSWQRDYQHDHKVTKVPDEELLWVEPLLDDISRAVESRKSRPHDETMASLDPDNVTRFQPIITRSRTQPDGRMEFDLYIFRVPEKWNVPERPLEPPSN